MVKTTYGWSRRCWRYSRRWTRFLVRWSRHGRRWCGSSSVAQRFPWQHEDHVRRSILRCLRTYRQRRRLIDRSDRGFFYQAIILLEIGNHDEMRWVSVTIILRWPEPLDHRLSFEAPSHRATPPLLETMSAHKYHTLISIRVILIMKQWKEWYGYGW